MISPEDAYILERCIKYPEVVAKYGESNVKALIINALVETPFKPEGAVTGYKYYGHEQVKVDDMRYDVYIYVHEMGAQLPKILNWTMGYPPIYIFMALGSIGLLIYLFRGKK